MLYIPQMLKKKPKTKAREMTFKLLKYVKKYPKIVLNFNSGLISLGVI